MLTRPLARRRARQLFDLVAGFVYAQVLLACVRLRLFDVLAQGPQTAQQLAATLQLPLDAAQRLLDAAVALRLLEHRSADRYGLGALGAPMVGNAALAAMVEHHAALYEDLADPVALLRRTPAERQYNALARYWAYGEAARDPNAVDGGADACPNAHASANTSASASASASTNRNTDDSASRNAHGNANAIANGNASESAQAVAGDSAQAVAGNSAQAIASHGAHPHARDNSAQARIAAYSALMAASQPLVADEILHAYSLRKHRCLLDVGGGNGSFLISAAACAPRLRLMLFDLPAVAEAARLRLAADGLAARATVHGGSFLHDALPAGADVVSLVRVVHDHDDAPAMRLLRAVHAALPMGGTLLLAEPMAGTAGAETMGDAYFGIYLLAMGRGRPRSRAVLSAMLQDAGFEAVRAIPTRVPLQTQLLVARRLR